ncbi:PilZ domain-containing protein [Glaciecola sp. XM2]|uniref:PilZ domain-containing protein n=1 Tax=Glaciecola sp. XM2 TaxID=1914931 RepID=UPI001BDED7D0|nr:PilZ domain-containing protein [Glaciecola sp. XM2]MBT1452307.1 PilZ domain-containing protein [Glaciecola sp. XM2]
MTPDLAPYKELIRTLAPLVNRSDFNSDFEERTKKMSSEMRFLLKMEIKRLAKPCIRSVDLRAKVKDECRLYSYQGIEHYLHINGILHFEKLVKRYGQYTFGVYEGILEFAQAEKQKYALQESMGSSGITEIAEPEKQYITPCQELLNYPIRKEERLNYVTQIEIFFEDHSSIHAATSDVSLHGLRIRLKDLADLHLLKTFEPISIVFRSVERSAGISRTPISYQVLGVSGEGSRTSIHLLRKYDEQHKAFDDFVNTLFKLHKRRYKVNLDNVEMAVGTKIYEQSFINSTPSLPVYVTRNKDASFHASYVSVNGCGKRILDYWTDEQKQPVIGYLLNPKRLATLVNNNGSCPNMVVYCFHHIKDEKIYFYSASKQELAEHPELAETFLSYGSRKVSWRVYHLACSDILPNQGVSPTSIPNGVSKEIDRLNKSPSPKLQGKLGKLSNMISVTDITNDAGQECYQKRALNKDLIKDLKVFGHPRNKPPVLVEAMRHRQTELRRQTRYVLRTAVVIKSANDYLEGVTEDVSVSGLKLELDEEFIHRLNSKVHVSFSKLDEITDSFDLNNLQYRVKHISYDKKVLHLEAVSEDEASEAEQFFSELISNNIDRLPALEHREEVAGLSHALRAIHAKTTPQFCAYIEKKQQGFLPAMATMNPLRAAWMRMLHDTDNLATVNLGWLYQDNDLPQPFLKHSLKMLRIDPRPISTEIYISYRSGEVSHISPITAKWQYQLPSHHAQKMFIEQAQKQGEFFAFSVNINKALKPDLEHLEQELLYLGQHAIHKATYFEERMWDIAGCVFLTDITDEFRFRYSSEDS